MARMNIARRRRTQHLSADVAAALLHLGDIPWLSTDSPLVDLPEVMRRSERSRQLFAEGQALHDVLIEAATRVTDRLEGPGKVQLWREILQGVCAGKSLSRIAREQGYSREHLSRAHWHRVVALVADELATVAAAKKIG